MPATLRQKSSQIYTPSLSVGSQAVGGSVGTGICCRDMIARGLVQHHSGCGVSQISKEHEREQCPESVEQKTRQKYD